jgi:thiol-disulfide isomerase/thioredoxin
MFGSVLGASVRWLTLHEKRLVALVVMSASLILVGISAFKVVPAWSENRAYSAVERSITPFAFETLAGQKISSNDLKGHVVVLSFWATWCGPCQAELPEIAAVARHYAGNPKVLVFAVDSGTEGDTLDKAKTYLTRKGLTLTGAIDSVDGESPGAAARSLKLSDLPVLYVLDPSGKLRVTHSGYDSSEDLQRSLSRQIDSLL